MQKKLISADKGAWSKRRQAPMATSQTGDTKTETN